MARVTSLCESLNQSRSDLQKKSPHQDGIVLQIAIGYYRYTKKTAYCEAPDH